MILVYDTETSGFVNQHAPASDPSQPHLVQLACTLIEDDGKELASVSLIVKPEGYKIPEQASKVHGISTELAIKAGVQLRVAVAMWTNLRALAQATAAHNDDFDQLVMAAALHRVGAQPASPGPDRRICTMRESIDLLQLPPTERMKKAGFNKFKPPNLQELHKFLFDGIGFEGAHDALIDVRACARCLVKLRTEHALCL